MRLSTRLRIPVTLLAVGAAFSCATVHRQDSTLTEEPTVVRIVTFVLGLDSEAAWASACRGLVAAAIESHIRANWLIHRVDDRNYYLVTFGSRAEIRGPHSIAEGFAGRDVGVFKNEFKQLAAVAYRVSSDEIWEQVPAWGTTADMNSLTHPGVDQRSYRIRSWQLSAVDSVLTDMADLLREEHYPFPTEGFRVGLDTDVTVHVLSFFGEREEYHLVGRPEAFMAARGKHQQWQRLVERLGALTQTSLRTESRYVHELSYDPWLLEQQPGGGG